MLAGHPSPRRSVLLAALALVVLVAAVHGRTLLGGWSWVYDDIRFVVKNPRVLSPESWTSFFTDPRTTDPLDPTGIVRPLRTFEFALDARLFGLDAAAFRAHSLLWFAAGAVAFLLLAKDLLGDLRTAFVAAALWALHPMQTECADWISSRGDVASGALVFASVWAALRSRGGDVALVASLVLAALAMGYKESGVVVPGLVVLARAVRRGGAVSTVRTVGADAAPSLGRVVLGAWPWFVVAGAYLVYRSSVQVGTTAHVQYTLGGSVLGTWATMARGFGAYVLFALLPVRPATDWYMDPSSSFADPAALAWLAVHVAALVFGVRKLLTRDAAGAAILWFYAALVPVANWPFHLGIPTAERFLHVALGGFALLAALAARSAARGGRGVWAAVACVVAAFGAISWRRASDWRDEPTFFAATAAVVASPRAEAYLAAQSRREAVADVLAAGRLPPGAERDRASAAARARLETALGHAHRALRLWRRIEGRPASDLFAVGDIHVNASNLCIFLDRAGEALWHADEAVRIREDGGPERHYDRALALLRLGRGAAAFRATERALALGLDVDDEIRWMLERASALCEGDGETEVARAALDAAIAARVPGADRIGSLREAVAARADDRIRRLRSALTVATDDTARLDAAADLAVALAADGRIDEIDAVVAAVGGMPRIEAAAAGRWPAARWAARATADGWRRAHAAYTFDETTTRPAQYWYQFGRCAEEAGEPRDALRAFDAFLRGAVPAPGTDDPRTARARAAVDRLSRPCPDIGGEVADDTTRVVPGR